MSRERLDTLRGVTWQHFRRDGLDGTELVGIDGDLLGDEPLRGCGSVCSAVVAVGSSHPDDTREIEATVEDAIAGTSARVVATRRASSEFELVVVTDTDGDATTLASRIGKVAGAVVVVHPNDGESQTDRFRPVGIERQSLDDLRAVDELFRAGDTGAERNIEHVVESVDATRTGELARSLRAVGYEVDARPGDDGILVRHHARPADVTPDAWTIGQIAQRLGARYAGWSCPVVRAPSRGRFFRRGT